MSGRARLDGGQRRLEAASRTGIAARRGVEIASALRRAAGGPARAAGADARWHRGPQASRVAARVRLRRRPSARDAPGAALVVLDPCPRTTTPTRVRPQARAASAFPIHASVAAETERRRRPPRSARPRRPDHRGRVLSPKRPAAGRLELGVASRRGDRRSSRVLALEPARRCRAGARQSVAAVDRRPDRHRRSRCDERRPSAEPGRSDRASVPGERVRPVAARRWAMPAAPPAAPTAARPSATISHGSARRPDDAEVGGRRGVRVDGARARGRPRVEGEAAPRCAGRRAAPAPRPPRRRRDGVLGALAAEVLARADGAGQAGGPDRVRVRRAWRTRAGRRGRSPRRPRRGTS